MTDHTDAPWSPDPDADGGMRIRFGENVRLLRARAHISQEVNVATCSGPGIDT